MLSLWEVFLSAIPPVRGKFQINGIKAQNCVLLPLNQNFSVVPEILPQPRRSPSLECEAISVQNFPFPRVSTGSFPLCSLWSLTKLKEICNTAEFF